MGFKVEIFDFILTNGLPNFETCVGVHRCNMKQKASTQITRTSVIKSYLIAAQWLTRFQKHI